MITDRQQARNEAAAARGRAVRSRDRAGRIEDYLFIGGAVPDPATWHTGTGGGLSARQAAERLGVSTRTITRYRRALREAS